MEYPEFFNEDCIGIKYRIIMINDDLIIGTLTDVYDGVAVFGDDSGNAIEINMNYIISVELVEQK